MSSFEIYLRRLRVDDAFTSWRWRNDRRVWRYTGSKPDREITLEVEAAWLAGVLEDTQSIRYAICLREKDTYIGNVQLTSVTEHTAEFHIFIGEPEYWNKGIGGKATASLLEIARDELALQQIFLTVDKRNKAAVEIYRKQGFLWQGDKMVKDLA
ncbi:MAG: diamine N-acetyltransferase [Halieaceae bacterium]